MRLILLLFSLLPAFTSAEEWLFKGFTRLTIPQADAGIARVFNIPTERFYQSKLSFKTEVKANKTLEVIFTAAEIRYLVNNVPTKPDFDLSDNLIGRRIILQKTDEGFHFYDDPDHILSEALPFDINMLCLMLDLSLFPYEKSVDSQIKDEQKTLIWSLPYVNQDKYRILERQMATLSHEWGENQVFTVNINRDEVLKDQKTVATGTADGLGDGIISHKEDGTVTTVNLTVHLDKSLFLQESEREGRLSISEEQDFVLEAKP